MTLNESSGERFGRNYSLKVSVARDSSLIYSSADRLARILPSHSLVLLDCCRTFRSLDEHALECANFLARERRGVGQPSFDSIKRHLSALADAGLLISETAILKACQRSEQPPPRIASVGVITRNRIDSLERCLRSYIANSKKYQRTNDFVVMDDSERAETRASNRSILSVLTREFDVQICYAGREEKNQYEARRQSSDT